MLTTEQATLQIKRRMLAQNKKSTGIVEGMGVINRYRGDDGTACSIGCVMPDSLYDPEMEGQLLEQLLEDFPAFAEYFKDVDIMVLYRAQEMHDERTVAEWPAYLDSLVLQYAA